MIRKSGYRFSEKIMREQLNGGAIGRRELDALFQDFLDHDCILLAVSGGPDSTALLWLASRWRDGRKNAPKLIAATVDHGLRKESRAEAFGVAKLARKLKISHRILAWRGKKPKSGLQEAARAARYGLLLSLARETGAAAIVTAHTRDDQAETMLHRIGRGSGVTGLSGIRPKSEREGVAILRPLLGVPKARCEATLRKEKIFYALDPTNRDPKYLRPRLRALAPLLAKEGIDAARLSQLARRIARAEAAVETAVTEALPRAQLRADDHSIEYDARSLFALPEEIGLRLVGRAVNQLGHEGPVELGKLEALFEALRDARRAGTALRRTLAGALVELSEDRLKVEPAPLRRRLKKHPKRPGKRG
jgi:tRNA(Ile)-lysidine synthase